jgi:peptidoglycan/xylan/chitin deacetylase (PgdA/CDA1 family)
MPRRWDWHFEDREPDRVQLVAQSTARADENARRIQIRRRRIAAAVVLAAVLLALVAVAPGSVSRGSHPARAASNANTGAGAGAHAARAPAARAPEENPRIAVKAVLAYTPFVKDGGDRGRDIALSFDDGPGPYTPAVLSVLERLHVRATFFEIGAMLRYFSASAVRELRDGDVIGDHTQTHPEMATLSAHAQHEQLFEQILHIELLDGPRPTLFRPPYGSYNATTMRQLRALHLLMVLWSVDTDDYLQPGVPVIVQRALAGAHPGAIILMHDAGGTRTQTITALPTIINKLRARGFHLVTVPELLRDDPPPPGQTLPSSLRGD